MEYPNKIFIIEGSEESVLGKHNLIVTVAASSSEVAREHVKELIGLDAEPTWLMNAGYLTIYRTEIGGRVTEKKIQAKILYNASFWS
jgi:hypothetical protein